MPKELLIQATFLTKDGTIIPPDYPINPTPGPQSPFPFDHPTFQYPLWPEATTPPEEPTPPPADPTPTEDAPTTDSPQTIESLCPNLPLGVFERPTVQAALATWPQSPFIFLSYKGYDNTQVAITGNPLASQDAVTNIDHLPSFLKTHSQLAGVIILTNPLEGEQFYLRQTVLQLVKHLSPYPNFFIILETMDCPEAGFMNSYQKGRRKQFLNHKSGLEVPKAVQTDKHIPGYWIEEGHLPPPDPQEDSQPEITPPTPEFHHGTWHLPDLEDTYGCHYSYRFAGTTHHNVASKRHTFATFTVCKTDPDGVLHTLAQEIDITDLQMPTSSSSPQVSKNQFPL